ncbi:MAG: hypothetical protein SGJ11_13705 [Phycisphaerae bacterium]|nr:hypothetical protein [Phycisphaerae bacterium]
MRTASNSARLHSVIAVFGSFAVTPALVTCMAAACLAPVLAFTAPFQSQEGPFWAAVRGDNVMIRSGPSVQSHYVMGRLQAGQNVKVLSVDHGWAKIAAVGPVFQNVTGFVKQDDAVVYDKASKKLAVRSASKLFATNVDAESDPAKSWRQLLDLAQGDSLTVTEERTSGSDTYYAVRLPTKSEVWVNNQFLAPLTQEEADAIEASLRGGPAVPPPMVVTPTTPPATNPPAIAPPPSTDPATGAAPTPPQQPAAADEPEVDSAADEASRLAAERQAERDAAAEAAQQRRLATEAQLATYADLEGKWTRVRNEPQESAELDALRGRYLALSEDPTTPSSTRALATSRAQQIAMRIEVQQHLLDLAAMRAKKNERREGVAQLDIALWNRKDYDAVGRLNASTVYDGDRLPLLYKLADPTTGHTLSYVLPGPTTKPSEALGLIVGIKGLRRYDETLRVNVISPEVIVVLDTAATSVMNPSATPANP